MEKLREKTHRLSNDAGPVVMAFPGLLSRTGAVESRATATETRLATLEGLTARVERIEQTVALVKATATDVDRRVQTTGAILLGIFNRVWPIITAIVIGYLVVRLGLK